MRVAVWKSRALALAVVFAIAGFSYAVSTTAPEAHESASSRGVGTSLPLRFTNPLIGATANDFDLGDACFGSVVTRYITAEGGVKPYRFTSFGPDKLDTVTSGTKTTLQLGLSGVLAGTLPPTISPASTTITGAPGFRFSVTVTDAKGTNAESKSGFFNLFLVDCRNIFRFAVDRLPDARLAESYLARVDVLGGRSPYLYTVLSVVDAGTGASLNLQQDLGLFIARDGTLMGRPLRAGIFLLRVHCEDAFRQVANNRANTAPDQDLVLNVLPNPITSTDLATLSCSVRGTRDGNGRDSLRYKGLFNTLGMDVLNLVNAEISFRLGDIGFTGRLDARGRFAASLPDKVTLPDKSKIRVKVNPKNGTVDVSIQNGNFDKALNAAALTNGTARRTLQVTIGDAAASSEVLDFESRVSGLKFTLNYSLARNGLPAAGIFQIVSVKGKDGATLSGQTGDAWRVNFLAAPRSGVADISGPSQGLDNASAITVRIGQNFSQTFSGAPLRSNGERYSFRGDIQEGVKSFGLDTRSFRGSLTTNVLATRSTGIPQAINAAASGNLFFPLGLDVNRGATRSPFSGEHARRIFGLKNQFRDAPPRR